MKTLRTAALVIGAVALIATGVGAVIGAAGFLAATGVSLATISAIGTVAGIVAQLTAPKPKSTIGGSQTDFKLDPTASMPIAFGRTFAGGNIVARDTWGADNQYQGFVIAYSGCGPVTAVDEFHIDRAAVAIGGGGAIGGQYAGFAWFQSQRGLCPEAAAVPIPIAGFPGWGASSKLSGICSGAAVLKFDKKGKKWSGGSPRMGVVLRGVQVYDPRLDDTYPGGAGPCRFGNEATYVESRSGPLQALTFALGWRQNGKPVGGVQAPRVNVDVPAFVAAANVAAANGWECGGVYYTGDPKWNVIRALLQSAAAEPVWLGAKLSVKQSRPRVSVGTIRTADLRGEVKVIGTQSRRAGRINGIIGVYRSEVHGWEMVPAAVIRVPAYVLEDRGERTREVQFPTVQDVGQLGVMAAYEMVNGREIGPASIPVGPEWAGVEPGMCLNLEIPEFYLADQWEVVGRSFNHQSAVITLELRSETAGKHPFALGAATDPPPTPSLAPPDYDEIAVNYEAEADAVVAIRTSNARFVEITAAAEAIDTTADFTVAPWALNSVTVAANAIAGPGGVGLADTFTVSATPDARVDRAALGARIIRVTFKAGTAGWFYAFMDTAAGFKATWVNTATGALGTNDLAGTLEDLGGGWRRLSITGTCNAEAGFGWSNANTTTAATVGETGHVFEVVFADAAGTGTVTITAHVRDYADRDLTIDAATLAGVPASVPGFIFYDDPTRADPTPVFQFTNDYDAAVNSADHPFRHYVGATMVPAPGNPDVTGQPPPYTGGGGYCVEVDTAILMADGSERPAKDVAAGDVVRSRHHLTMAWGEFRVTAVEVVSVPMVLEWMGLLATPEHRVQWEGRWQTLLALGGKAIGPARVVKISVADGQSYISNGLLSHNVKWTGPEF